MYLALSKYNNRISKLHSDITNWIYFMPKKLCAYKEKEVEQNLADLSVIVEKSKFICKKCARTACEKKYLCKPVKINSKKNKLHKKAHMCKCCEDE